MRISFLVNEITGGWEPTDTRLGGTERSIVEWAEELAKRKHSVTVLRNSRDDRILSVVNGVEYRPRDYESKPDITINIKSPEVPPLGKTIFYTNDVDADRQDLSKYDAVIHISYWAKYNIPVNNPNVHVIPHGYDHTKIYPGKKVKRQCIYTSSPDRGLNTLLRAWLDICEVYPDATLLVTYGADGPEVPGVKYLGNLDEDQMNKLYRESDIWCHPASGGELQCIAGLKAQAAGCIPVVMPIMALKENIRHGYFANGPIEYRNRLLKALDGTDNKEIRTNLAKEHYITIEESTNKLLDLINSVLLKHATDS